MKKNILLGLVVLTQIGLTYGQSTISEKRNELNFEMNENSSNAVKPVQNIDNAKALGTVFWEDDFSTDANWTSDRNGKAAPYGWNIGTTVNTWWANFSGGINSTSDGGFAEVYNGDYVSATTGTQEINVVYTLTSLPIDIQTEAGTDQVTLSFEQFGALFNDGQEVQISTNGVDYTTVYTNNDRTVFVGNNPTAVYGNPETILVNLASYIAGDAGSVTIRFRWTSRFPSDPALQAWTTFGWFIDDVQLITNPDWDLDITSNYWGSLGLYYDQIPLTQVAPIDFSANVLNGGTQDLTNVVYTVDVNTGEWIGTSASTTLTPGSIDSLFTTTQFTPSALGNYVGTRTISQTEIDDVPTNNNLSDIEFDVTNFVYARDNNTPDGTATYTTEFEVGNLFDIYADQDLYGIDIRLTTGTTIGNTYYARLYGIDAEGEFEYLIETQYYEAVPSDLNVIRRLAFPVPYPLTANTTYLVVVGAPAGGIVVSEAGYSADQTSFLYYPDAPTGGPWFFTNNTPVVRMDFDPSVGLTENELLNGVSVFPNPSNNEAKVEFNLANASDVTINVTDITGKTVETVKLGNVNAGVNSANLNVANYATGIYNVVITTNETSVTSKLIKK